MTQTRKYGFLINPDGTKLAVATDITRALGYQSNSKIQLTLFSPGHSTLLSSFNYENKDTRKLLSSTLIPLKISFNCLTHNIHHKSGMSMYTYFSYICIFINQKRK